MALRTKNAYFIQGVESFIQGKLHAVRQANDVYGSWQEVAKAKGYNALLTFFPDIRDHYTYVDKVNKSVISTEPQLNKYKLVLVDNLDNEHVIYVPYLLCQPSAMLAVLEPFGFHENRKY